MNTECPPPAIQKARLVNAFTLAEVLVTLGIIGVVSAMTIPTLVKNHQRQVYVTQLRKVYSELSQAVEMYTTDQRAIKFGETRIRNNPTEMTRFFNTYFKITKDCGTSYIPCFGDVYTTIDGSRSDNAANGQCNLVITIADGTAICADVVSMEAVEGDSEEDNINESVMDSRSTLAIEVDINGSQGPNIYGRDRFWCHINENGEIYDPTFDEDNPNSSVGLGRIINDGWQMNY